MQKREFRYRQLRFILVWMLVLGAPFILFVPDLLSRIEGAAYYIANTLINDSCCICFMETYECPSWNTKKGLCWKENGVTVLEYGGKKEILNSVTELFLTDRHASSQGINILIRNNGRKIELLSEALDKETSIEETTFYNILSQVLAENPQLVQEKDVFGEAIDYWYKAR